ncbi:helix-turn-helix transcriptional regulator [Agrobacterium sp. a22-2]|uniref:transcriptional regulator VisR n=1 Tax=Agrobacterium sp. a22-2 TaxID=2283840 RepID=UPI001445935A|nr:LuxR C-terminal-related transcriptional regulator [Agrobacterium sp. a22-2]NKN34845.1 helix-turn-helix transcriptional regulator [Agrobacterium sp. a22-2]
MAYSGGFSDGGVGDFQSSRTRLAASRPDIFPKLVAMQKTINAKSFAVLRVSGAGLPGKRKLYCEMENWGPAHTSYCEAFVASYGDRLLTHIDASLLPLVWNARDDSSFTEASDFTAFVVRLAPGPLPFSGIAFPVRLGAVGNGYMVFTTTGGMDVPGEMILDMHSRSCKLMMDILSLTERRAAPSESLSDREIACLQLAGDGRISEEIAEKLGLSVHTVNAYLGSATIKLDSVNRIQAIAKAIRLGYIN